MGIQIDGQNGLRSGDCFYIDSNLKLNHNSLIGRRPGCRSPEGGGRFL